jgi:16S rRNA (cytosine1402-N4)-methyltransferase
MQIDEAERGFSFMKDAPLDMRMSQSGTTAADIVNNASESELIRILREYGEERDAKRIARAILHSRGIAPITTTRRLAEIVSETLHAHGGMKIHPATRTFQALRIEVNQELAELEAGLRAAEHLLKPGGRLVIISFHSLEDRIVKQFMLSRSDKFAAPSRHSPAALMPVTNPQNTFDLTPKSAIAPSEQEVTQNPRARSAKLRCATRTANPVTNAA